MGRKVGTVVVDVEQRELMRQQDDKVGVGNVKEWSESVRR